MMKIIKTTIKLELKNELREAKFDYCDCIN